jgi:hypothetical protein
MNDVSSFTKIRSPLADAWARLFNLRYRMLLSLLSHLFRVPREGSPSGGAGRAQILSRLFGEMYNMKTIAGILVQLPLDDDLPNGDMAGPPFQVPYTVEEPISKMDFWHLHLDLLDQATRLAEGLSTWDSPTGAAPEAKRYAGLMKEADLQTSEWVKRVLAGDGLLP